MLAAPEETSARDAAETLDDIARLRRRTRRSLGTPWFPLCCFGALTALSAPLLAGADANVLLPLWLVAGGAGMLLTRRHYRRRTHRRGVSGDGPRTGLIAAALFAGCLAAVTAGGAFGGRDAGLLVQIAAVLIGYLVVGWRQRSVTGPLAVAPGAALAAVLVAAHLAPWLIELSFGTTLVAAGVGLLAFERRA